jgi:hypothetical protein
MRVQGAEGGAATGVRRRRGEQTYGKHQRAGQQDFTFHFLILPVVKPFYCWNESKEVDKRGQCGILSQARDGLCKLRLSAP